MTYIFIIIGIVAGAAVGYLVASSRMGKERTSLVSDNNVLRSQLTNAQSSADAQKEHYEALISQARDDAEKQLSQVRDDAEKQLSQVRDDAEKQKKEMKESFQQQMDQQAKIIREQINSASEEILKKRSEELSSTNKEQLGTILNPLQEGLRQMREAVEKSGREHSVSMERLDASIKENLKQAQEVGDRADKLAQALTSENKVQGNFGELRLRTLLEGMDLKDGVQFEEQAVMKDEEGANAHSEDGHILIPDVILHFPDKRDVIIDSKMSLKAFEDYFNASTPEEKEDALKRHIASVRKHVSELAQKNYSSYIKKGNNKLDFVVMYIFSESALQLALSNDPTLWKWAYDKGVVISGSQNLYMMLRVLEMTWRQTHQVENQDKIMEAANMLVDRVQMFYERFKSADEQLDKTQKSFAKLRTVISPSGQSIVTAANKLLKFGVKENPKRKLRLPKAEEEESGALGDG